MNRPLIIELVDPVVFIPHSLLVILAQRLFQSIASSYDDLPSSLQMSMEDTRCKRVVKFLKGGKFFFQLFIVEATICWAAAWLVESTA